MKNIAALIMLTFLAVTGYYVGAAVAMNHNAGDTPNEPAGVMVIEEGYGVVANPDTQNPKQSTDKTKQPQGNNAEGDNSDNDAIVVEEIDEMETAE